MRTIIFTSLLLLSGALLDAGRWNEQFLSNKSNFAKRFSRYTFYEDDNSEKYEDYSPLLGGDLYEPQQGQYKAEEYYDCLCELGFMGEPGQDKRMVVKANKAQDMQKALYEAVNNNEKNHVIRLLHAGVNPNHLYRILQKQETLLHLALQKKHLELFPILLSYGADATIKNGCSKNVIDCALKAGRFSLANQLLYESFGDAWPLLHYIVYSSSINVLKKCLESYRKHKKGFILDDTFWRTPLHVAIKIDSLKKVDLLLKFNADPHVKNIFAEDCYAIAQKLKRKDILARLNFESVRRQRTISRKEILQSAFITSLTGSK